MYENYRVLFVDDEVNILNTLRRGLMDEEYYCLFANSAAEALELFESNKIDVIVSDIRMPEMSGLELLKIIAEKSPLTVKIVLSGYTQLPQVLSTINQVDIFKFITKPWSLEDLVMVVRKALDFYIVQEENANYKKALEAKNQAYQNIIKRINEIVENAKKSSEMLGICGRALLRFGKNYTPQERQAYQTIFSLLDKIFDILSDAVTGERKEFDTHQLSEMIADLTRQMNPNAAYENREFHFARVTVNEKMLEAALSCLLMIFSEEFNQGGCFVHTSAQDNLKVSLVCPNAKDFASPDMPGLLPVLDVKIDFAKSILEEILGLCQIELHLTKADASLTIDLTVLD